MRRAISVLKFNTFVTKIVYYSRATNAGSTNE
jgi:hypothetical protein